MSGYTFWAVESVGLSGIIWYTPLLVLLGDKVKRLKTKDMLKCQH